LTRLNRPGVLRRVLRGVYVDASVPDDLRLRAQAVGLLVPPGVVVCRRTAAWLYGVDALPIGAHERIPDVQVTTASGKSGVRREGCRGYQSRLCPGDVQTVHGVEVTTPLRTTVDLARLLPRPDALAALDAMLRAELVTRSELVDRIAAFEGERGVVQARALIDLADRRAESPMESRMRLRLIDAGFPIPEPQIAIFDNGILLYRLDLGWRRQRVAVEYDGLEFHRPEHWQRDTARRTWLENRGWRIVVASNADVLGDGAGLELTVGELLGISPRLPASFRDPHHRFR
jgi:hypothetical protein